MTEAEMLYRLRRGEDMKYYKLLPDGFTIVRKSPEETKRWFEESRWVGGLERTSDESDT